METERSDLAGYRAIIVDVTRLAASPVDVQLASLPDFVCHADEVALEFERAYGLAPQVVEGGLLSEECFGMIARLDRHFEVMSDDKSLWSNECLATHEAWETARAMARAILVSMGEELRPPSLDGVIYVGSGD